MLKKTCALLVLLVMMGLLMCGCKGGEYKAEIEEINAGVEALGDVESGHIVVTTNVKAEEGNIALYDAEYVNDYYYNIVIKTFNYIAEKHTMDGAVMEPKYYVYNAKKYDMATGERDEEYKGGIGDFPDLLPYFFGAGQKAKYVGEVQRMTDDEHPNWQGYHLVRSDNYVKRANNVREKYETDGIMLSGYVDYWIDENGVLVKMNYVSRDTVTETVGADENGEGGTEVTDVINQSYLFEMVSYNDDSIAAMFPEKKKSDEQ